jgi:exosortase
METATRSRTAPFVIAAFGLLIIVYLPVIAGLVREWYSDGNYSHGFLVPAISAVLILLRRGSFSEILEPPGTSLTLRKIFIGVVVVCIGLSFVVDFGIAAIITFNAAGWYILGRAFVFQARQRRFAGWIDPAGDFSGLILVAVGLVLFVLANAAAEYFTLRLSLIVTFAGLVWMLFGRRFASDIWFELAFLVFMIPLPYVIYYAATFPMQLFATKVTVAILHLLGMSAVQQGNIIHLPGYSLEVAEACSGLRSLISLLALGAVYARLTQKGLPRQIILFLSTIPIAIAANIFRVTFTAVGAYAISKDLAEDFLHELSGMMVFVVAFIMLFIWGAILKIGSKKK